MTKAPSSVEPVSDVWSFAASLYQLLTGKFPYRFDPKRDPIDIILNENPVPIRDRMPGLEKNLRRRHRVRPHRLFQQRPAGGGSFR